MDKSCRAVFADELDGCSADNNLLISRRNNFFTAIVDHALECTIKHNGDIAAERKDGGVRWRNDHFSCGIINAPFTGGVACKPKASSPDGKRSIIHRNDHVSKCVRQSALFIKTDQLEPLKIYREKLFVITGSVFPGRNRKIT